MSLATDLELLTDLRTGDTRGPVPADGHPAGQRVLPASLTHAQRARARAALLAGGWRWCACCGGWILPR